MHQKLSQQTGCSCVAAICTAPGTAPLFVNYPVMRTKKTYRAISAIKSGSLRAYEPLRLT